MQLQSQAKTQRHSEQRKVLQYFIDVLGTKQDDAEYIQTLNEKVLPLIRLVEKEVTDEWIQIRTDYLDNTENAENRILFEIEDLFEKLKIVLKSEGLLSEDSIASACDSLESILKYLPEDERVYIFPRQHEVAIARLKWLYHVIAVFGRKDLVAFYVKEFSTYSEASKTDYMYSCRRCEKLFNATREINCPELNCSEMLRKTSMLQTVYQTGILEFNKQTFIPIYFCIDDFGKDYKKTVAFAWENLELFEWAYPYGRRDYFRKKALRHNKPKGAYRSAQLLEFHSFWVDVKILKERTCDKESEYYLGSLLPFLNKLKRNFKLVCEVLGFSTQDSLNPFCTPQTIELAVETDKENDLLVLIVKWAEGLYGVYKLHTFHYDDANINKKFVEDLVGNCDAELDDEQVSGAHAPKFLKRDGFIGVLWDLFIRSARGNRASLYSNKINLLNKSDSIQKKLIEHLEILEFLEWRDVASSRN